MSNPLTSGSVREMMVNPENLPKGPILQVLGLKKIDSGGQERYRMVLSDGVHVHTCAMLGTQLNAMVNSEEIDVKAVVRLEKYICNIIQGTRKVLIILELHVLHKSSEVPRYGNPKAYSEETDAQNNERSNSKPASVQQSTVRTTKNQQALNGPRNHAPVSRNQSSHTVFPISALNPYQNRWTICARITSKTPIKTWSNSRGEGRFFSVDLIDQSGEIRATCFTNLVDKFYDQLEPNKVYYITKGNLKPANKRYSSLKNDYEMTFNNDTTVELCTDNDELPTLQFNFCEIANIQNVEKDHIVDVIGVCSNISPCSEITVKATGKQVNKRDVTLVDKTASVSCTLWGSEAENFEKYENTNPIIAVKGARVSDFGGRSLSLLSSSTLQVNPDNLQEGFKLRGWYDQVGYKENISSISGLRGEGGGVSNVYKTLWDIKNEGLGTSEKADYFNVAATVAFFRKENCLYKACPKDDCNKKVIEDGDHYRCEKCGQTYPDFKYRLILSANITDHTGEQWVTCFQESAEQLLSKTANEVGELLEDQKAYEQMFADSTFKSWIFKIRAKIETYNDESRLKCSVVSVTAVDYRKEGARLLDQIEKMGIL